MKSLFTMLMICTSLMLAQGSGADGLAGLVVARQAVMQFPLAEFPDSTVAINIFETVDFTSADSLVIQTGLIPEQEEAIAKTNIPAGFNLIGRQVASLWVDKTDADGGVVLCDFTTRLALTETGEVSTLPPAIVALQVVRLGNAMAINGVRYAIADQDRPQIE